MKISIASDHAGFEYKNNIIIWLKENDYEFIDFGTYSTDSCDYPDFAKVAAEAVASGSCEFGIIICGTGIGVSITANKVEGIRAANCCTIEMARLAREHNDANIVTIGARLIDLYLSKKIIELFLTTKFSGGRHTQRVGKIHSLTGR